jgi:hypothetical protein
MKESCVSDILAIMMRTPWKQELLAKAMEKYIVPCFLTKRSNGANSRLVRFFVWAHFKFQGSVYAVMKCLNRRETPWTLTFYCVGKSRDNPSSCNYRVIIKLDKDGNLEIDSNKTLGDHECKVKIHKLAVLPTVQPQNIDLVIAADSYFGYSKWMLTGRWLDRLYMSNEGCTKVFVHTQGRPHFKTLYNLLENYHSFFLEHQGLYE